VALEYILYMRLCSPLRALHRKRVSLQSNIVEFVTMSVQVMPGTGTSDNTHAFLNPYLFIDPTRPDGDKRPRA
jgi:hypothetical protein